MQPRERTRRDINTTRDSGNYFVRDLGRSSGIDRPIEVYHRHSHQPAGFDILDRIHSSKTIISVSQPVAEYEAISAERSRAASPRFLSCPSALSLETHAICIAYE